jgi:photosystem II PsbZ protein
VSPVSSPSKRRHKYDDKWHSAHFGEQKMSIIFQISLAALVILSFVMVVGVPVAYATPQNWNQSKNLIFLGSGIWVALVILVGVLNFLVV